MQSEPIASIDLMERAGSRFTETLCAQFDLSRYERTLVFCGPGNNGGDAWSLPASWPRGCPRSSATCKVMW